MEVRAVAKTLRVQPRKVRLVAEAVKGKPAQDAADRLRYHPSKGARLLRKVILSAIANAVENENASPETLRIKSILIDQGPVYKRLMARAQGRGNRILKKTSHITVIVEDDYEPRGRKKGGPKPKPRPKFEKPRARRAEKAEAVTAPPAVTDVTSEAAAASAEAPTEVVAPETSEAAVPAEAESGEGSPETAEGGSDTESEQEKGN